MPFFEVGSIAIFPPTLYIYEIEELNLVVFLFLTVFNSIKVVNILFSNKVSRFLILKSE